MKLRISQCTPLVFREATDDPTATALRFTQHYGRYDHILLQAFGDTSTTVTCKAYDAVTGAQLLSTACTKLAVDGGYLYYLLLPVFDAGVYYCTLTGGGVTLRSMEWEVVDDPTIGGESIFIEYSNTTNDTPLDAVFTIGGVRQVFQLRLRGGFKPQGYTPNVVQETWRTQRQELRLLYSAPFDKWTLTVGTAQGVPVEYVRLLNNILSCDIVYINGKRWCRSEGSTPEKTLTMQGAQMFTASVDLERQPSLDDYPFELYVNGGSFNADYSADYDLEQV